MNQNSLPHVLIIDDSADMRGLLALLLTSKGYVTHSTANGSEALELLNSEGSVLPKVILLDLRMPVMDGYEFIQRKWQSSKLRDIPTILMTGEDDLRSIGQKIKGSEILIKPLKMKSVLDAVERNILLH